MKIYTKKILTLVAVMLAALSSCTSSFDEVNTDPNRPSADNVKAASILAYSLRYSTENMFDRRFDLQETAGFSGQIAMWMYSNPTIYVLDKAYNNNSWKVCYLTVSNLQSIIDMSAENSNMWAVATIFQCQMYQVISDRWGNIPYSDALKLDSNVVKPKYDKQSYIYPDLLKRLKKAVETLDATKGALGAEDLLFGGDITRWKKYGNSLRLRIAARIANIDPTDAKSTFEEILGNTTSYPIAQDNNDNVFFQWNAEYVEPYAYIFKARPNDFGVSKLIVETLQQADDPRLPVYVKPTANWTNATAEAQKTTEKYLGYQNGLKANANISFYSGIGTRFMSTTSLTGFSPWLRSCETYFAISYAASKGWKVGMTQEEAYNKAVQLSMAENSISDAATTAYLQGKGKYDGTQEQLFTQWWISVFKNSMEAWSLFRMSGYPSGNVIAPDSFYSGHNTPPMCYGYPDSERNLNSVNCSAEAAAEVNYYWGKQMWWDVRTGLK